MTLWAQPRPQPKPPRKWLGRRGGLWIGAGGLAVYLYMMLVEGIVLNNRLMPSIAELVGAFTVGAAFLYTMAYHLVPRDTVTVRLLLIAFGVGGLMATTIGSTFDSLVSHASGGVNGHVSLIALTLAGVSEEFAKIVAVVLLSWRLGDKSVRNGLFIGGAVGLGFASLEDLGYAVRFFDQGLLGLSPILSTMQGSVVRAVLTPFCHPAWTSLFAAAVFGASRNGRFRVTWRVIAAYLAVAAAHGLWDSSGTLLELTGIRPLVLLSLVVDAGLIALSIVVWLRVARRTRWDRLPPVHGSHLPPDRLQTGPPWSTGDVHPAVQFAPPAVEHRLPEA